MHVDRPGVPAKLALWFQHVWGGHVGILACQRWQVVLRGEQARVPSLSSQLAHRIMEEQAADKSGFANDVYAKSMPSPCRKFFSSTLAEAASTEPVNVVSHMSE